LIDLFIIFDIGLLHSVGQILQLPYVKSIIADFVKYNSLMKNIVNLQVSAPKSRSVAVSGNYAIVFAIAKHVLACSPCRCVFNYIEQTDIFIICIVAYLSDLLQAYLPCGDC